MAIQLTKAEHKQKPRTHAPWLGRAAMKVANTIVASLLRSPFHGVLSGTVLLLTFTGRKSGNSYTTPVSYLREEGELWVYTPSSWWKNLQGEAPVRVLLRGRALQGTADVVTSTQEVAKGIQTFFDRKGLKSAGQIGLSIDRTRQPSPEELLEVARNRVIVRIKAGL